MKKIFRTAIWVLLGLAALLLLALLATLTTVDRTPYGETAHYRQSRAMLDSMALDAAAATGPYLRAGWARRSLLPSMRLPLAGYGAREGQLMQGVKDSIFVRAVVLDNGNSRVGMLTADLLIIPVQVSRALDTALHSIGLSMDRLYLSATHTHGSIGGWDPSPVGEMFAGAYHQQVVQMIVQRMLEALQAAMENMQAVKVGFGQVDAGEFVYNRLVGAKGITDPWLRMMVLEREDSSRAVWLSFAAHATTLPDEEMRIHADYPGRLIQLLEARPDVDFAAFAAGAVGSHGPGGKGLSGQKKLELIASGLAERAAAVLDTLHTRPTTSLYMLRLPLMLGEPQLRISHSLRLRPWVFRYLAGQYPAYLLALKVGNGIFLGTPCDFSGELVPELHADNHFLMPTSFNGGYVGYITADKWYELDTYETRTMNWFGPGNGAYFVEIMNGMAAKLSSLPQHEQAPSERRLSDR